MLIELVWIEVAHVLNAAFNLGVTSTTTGSTGVNWGGVTGGVAGALGAAGGGATGVEDDRRNGRRKKRRFSFFFDFFSCQEIMQMRCKLDHQGVETIKKNLRPSFREFAQLHQIVQIMQITPVNTSWLNTAMTWQGMGTSTALPRHIRAV